MNSKPASTEARVGGSGLAAGPLVRTKLTSVMEAVKNTRQRALTSVGLIV
jgi:hypothetical protein